MTTWKIWDGETQSHCCKIRKDKPELLNRCCLVIVASEIYNHCWFTTFPSLVLLVKQTCQEGKTQCGCTALIFLCHCLDDRLRVVFYKLMWW